jgi:hypothetical protein
MLVERRVVLLRLSEGKQNSVGANLGIPASGLNGAARSLPDSADRS